MKVFANSKKTCPYILLVNKVIYINDLIYIIKHKFTNGTDVNSWFILSNIQYNVSLEIPDLYFSNQAQFDFKSINGI